MTTEAQELVAWLYRHTNDRRYHSAAGQLQRLESENLRLTRENAGLVRRAALAHPPEGAQPDCAHPDCGCEEPYCMARGAQTLPAAPAMDIESDVADLRIALRSAYAGAELMLLMDALERLAAPGVPSAGAPSADERAAAAWKWGYEYLQGRLESIGYHGWAHDYDEEIQYRIASAMAPTPPAPVAWLIRTEENACFVDHVSLDKPVGDTWHCWPIIRIDPLYRYA